MSTLQQIAVFLVDTIFSLYIAAIVIRFMLALVKADFYNPLSQALVSITNPTLVPLRRLIPAIGKIDTAAIVLALILIMLKTTILMLIQHGAMPNLSLIWFSLVEFAKLIVWIYIIAMILLAVMSWVGNTYGNPLVSILYKLTEPLLRPVRRVIPPISGLDLSPMVATIGLYVILIILNGLA